MSLKGVSPQRRRGRVLEEALLDATWAELTDRGYDAFTIDAVAARAGTSRAVLYRRWPSKQALVHAALLHVAGKNAVTAPDTGTLRGDMIELMRRANKVRVRMAIELFTRLGGFYRETGTSLAGISAAVLGGRQPLLEGIIRRAVDRGEISADRLTERIARLPLDLFRYELLMTLEAVPDDTIEEIVDTIFLPLVRPTH
ncbi:MAG TPA: TetR/AcrR family transcriptional regulator [Mycobacterium sp.]|nr:TetR/AcrR family transcriptional regulator [Mycobacterium sp.]